MTFYLFCCQGYRYRRAYVATQGPLADTTEDFWRMLWEHNSTIIVMLTKLREMGRVSCYVLCILSIHADGVFSECTDAYLSQSICVLDP